MPQSCRWEDRLNAHTSSFEPITLDAIYWTLTNILTSTIPFGHDVDRCMPFSMVSRHMSKQLCCRNLFDQKHFIAEFSAFFFTFSTPKMVKRGQVAGLILVSFESPCPLYAYLSIEILSISRYF